MGLFFHLSRAEQGRPRLRYDTVKGADWLGDQDAIQVRKLRERGRSSRALLVVLQTRNLELKLVPPAPLCSTCAVRRRRLSSSLRTTASRSPEQVRVGSPPVMTIVRVCAPQGPKPTARGSWLPDTRARTWPEGRRRQDLPAGIRRSEPGLREGRAGVPLRSCG